MKKNGFTKVELLVVILILLILAAILLPAFMKARESNRPICILNLKQIGSAVQQYSQEFDERLPPVAINAAPASRKLKDGMPEYLPYGWVDSLHNYLQDPTVYQCYTQGEPALKGPDPTMRGYTDYWYNSNLSKQQIGKLAAPTRTIMAGEGNDGTDNTNARYSRNQLPAAWVTTEGSPARRHYDRGNYLFADGHAKSLQPSQLSLEPVAITPYTFSPR